MKLTTIVCSGFTFGELAVVLAAYFIRDVTSLQLALFSPIIFLFLPILFVKESPRQVRSHLNLAGFVASCFFRSRLCMIKGHPVSNEGLDGSAQKGSFACEGWRRGGKLQETVENNET